MALIIDSILYWVTVTAAKVFSSTQPNVGIENRITLWHSFQIRSSLSFDHSTSLQYALPSEAQSKRQKRKKNI